MENNKIQQFEELCYNLNLNLEEALQILDICSDIINANLKDSLRKHLTDQINECD